MKNNKWITNLIIGIIFVAAGIFVMVRPDLFLTILAVVAGIYIIAGGIWDIWVRSNFEPNSSWRTIAIIKSIVSIVVGIVAISIPFKFAEAYMSVLVYIIAVVLAVEAVVDFIEAFTLRIKGITGRLVLEGIIDLLLSIVFFCRPQAIVSATITVLGVIAIIVGLFLAIYAIVKRNDLPVEPV